MNDRIVAFILEFMDRPMGHTYLLRHGRWRNTVVVDNWAITQVCLRRAAIFIHSCLGLSRMSDLVTLQLRGHISHSFFGAVFLEFRKQPPRLLPEMAGTRAAVLSTKRDWGSCAVTHRQTDEHYYLPNEPGLMLESLHHPAHFHRSGHRPKPARSWTR